MNKSQRIKRKTEMINLEKDWELIHDCIFAALDDYFGGEFCGEDLEDCIADIKQNIIDNVNEQN